MLSPSDIKRWREIVYIERTRPASLYSLDDEELQHDEQEMVELRTLEQMISELRQIIASRMNAVPLK
ncbi:30S ribosomal protein S17 domain protein [Oesophagostomum dentatum]|uniref:30S ribosomal protein S17 domain protein n=1 Tax=Oesophagostomum dentatum TaxID=61180 RepID=A0A0B1S185_OESDE|nr:30S ribosomal protein S17 domain protein [Oesophagostomum dentatum]